MITSDFDYELPESLIAQTPLSKRDASRLLVLSRHTGQIEHRRFYELGEFIKKGDCLVLNDSRVLPARLKGRRETGGAAELLLLSERGAGEWECLVRPGSKIKPGTKLIFGDGEIAADVLSVTESGGRIISFAASGVFSEALEKLGKMPLPPYIKSDIEDKERYQTVYSREAKSAAAPTAGLHFTRELLGSIEASGVSVRYLTLHVGLGTFRPVKTEKVEDHKMHAEFCDIPEETAEAVSKTKSLGGRVIAVGTTVCRALESFSDEKGSLEAKKAMTDIFIYPGYRFKCADALITNFHLPKSTLIMLVSAFAGRENIKNAYETAVREKYRFFSFGDCMLVF
ncbi:MAG: tRNA preQ1(34) S-adenosylmethionine ribosyltransferase-isomerase QueA [Oscillospiraceae bacterium]|nr:tRNA preQ1(34) S-adenosylmethionine ribosyltransferase-isomerase QueA [Oscillospiraceae bacterium]